MWRGVAAVLLALAFPVEATAKGDVQVAVCGASGCAAIDDASARSALFWRDLESVAPPPVSGFYSLRFAVRGSGPKVGYYVPAADLIAVIDEAGGRTGVEGVATWTAVPQSAAEALARAVERLEPFAPPTLASAEVGFRRVSDSGGYLELFAVKAAGSAAPPAADWQPIVLDGDRPNPWTDGATRLSYSPSTKQLRRGQEILRLPDDVAADLDARAPLDEEGRPWTSALAGAALGLALLAVLAFARAARRAPRRRSLGAT